jgi:hypothetical protein
MLMEYRAQILRGWPSDGAREKTEIVKQGVLLQNGDIVTIQPDGTVDKCTSTVKQAGIVVRGNYDSFSAGNSAGQFMTPQPTVAIAATTPTATASVMSVTTSTNHGYAIGDTIVVTTGSNWTGTGFAASTSYTVVIQSIPSLTQFTATGTTVPVTGTTTAGTNTAQLVSSTANNTIYSISNQYTYGSPLVTGGASIATGASGGKAIVLWGNYIVQTQVYQSGTGSWVPGALVAGGTGGQYVTSGVTAGNECGFVLQVQGANSTFSNPQTQNVVIVAY